VSGRSGPDRRLIGVVLALALTGCAHAHAPATAAAPPAAGPPVPIAVLPLEDLSGQVGSADKLTRIVFTELVSRGGWQVTDPGQVDGAAVAARIRSTGSLTREQVRIVSDSLGVRWLLTGAALEYGHVRTPDGDTPAVGISLRLIDGTNGKVRWAGQRYRSGDDHETVFGFGRVSDPQVLAHAAVAELLAELHPPAADTSSHAGTPAADTSSTPGGGRP